MLKTNKHSEILIIRTINTLKNISTNYKPTILASSMSIEDMVLTDMILRNFISINIFTLNTGRLHKETLEMLKKIKFTYHYSIAIFKPNPSTVKKYVKQHGLNGFYKNIELRKKCCYIRKIEPLIQALKGMKSWITGQRRTQSTTRSKIKTKEIDKNYKILKFNPLTYWSYKNVLYYIKKYEVQYNPLHDKGYSSIGCEPCTRPITKKENIRSGRWWWENSQKKECGLHMTK